ncbi:MAG: hypothetical protein J7L34_05780, partial [Thermotogaceae bacterium]|nr:hypothetical protein [Thermotogaceae bacterium]
MRRYNLKTVIVILVLTLIFTNGLAFDWRRVLSVAEKGNDSIQPLKLVLIFDFSTLPCRDENEYYFLSPLTRISYSKMYEILDEMNENSNLRAVFALSYKYIDDIKKYSVDGMDDYLKHESQVELSKYIPRNVPKPTNISEWNYIWLPELLKKSFPADSPINSYTSIYRMIASSLIGRLIALHSDKRIEVAALPYSGAPLGVIMNSHGKDWADINIKYSLNKLKSVFGSVTVFYPPLLDLSEDVLDILRDNKVMWTFSSYFSSSEPIIYNGVKIIGVDISLSEEIKKISTDEDFINWLSQIHRLQKEGKKSFAIVVDAHWWLFKSYEFKSAFLKVLSNDKYIKTVLPGDLEYKTAEKFIESSEVGDVTLWLKNKNRIYLWNRFNTLLSYYKSHEKFLRDSEKYKVILN